MEQEDLAQSHFKVTNHTRDVITGRYDGVDYKWRPGQSQVISGPAANHIFGFGEDDKSRAMNRLGWAPRSDMIDSALDKLGQIQFEEIQQVFRIKRDKPVKAKKPGNARSTVNAAGTQGETVAGPAVSPESPLPDPDDLEADLEDDEGDEDEDDGEDGVQARI